MDDMTQTENIPLAAQGTDVILGVFANRDEANAAINELQSNGYDPKNISIMMKDTGQAREMADTTGASVADGAVAGASTGAVVGALAGLLIGVGAIAIPGIGGILIGGPIATALGLTGAAATTASGAVTGAIAGGLVGALVGMGVPEEDARVYEERIKAGAILLAIPVMAGMTAEPESILQAHNAQQIRRVHSHT